MPGEFLQHLSAVCREHGILYVADEVQSGVGRTGPVWAVEHFGVEPDLVVSGKSLGGGLPLAGVTGPAKIVDAVPPGGLGGTFGGNPVACAAALATLDLVEESLAANATRVGDYLQRGLLEVQRRCPQIREVRGRGLMIGVEFESHAVAYEVEQAAFRRGLLLLTCGPSSLRLAPALTVTEHHADVALAILEAAITEAAPVQ
jgi:4-aminobutyrate aminotransferase